MQNMYINQSNFSKAEMEIYYELVNKFYPNRKEDGYFLDLGANIGTTCIYFKKYLDSKVKILAFEPITETFKFLKINLILNDIEDYVIEKLALSDKTEERDMYLRPGNPGGVGFLYNWGVSNSK